MSAASDELPIRRLLEAGRALVGELDTEEVLRRVLEAAREITGARYAALGVLNAERTELARFLTSGIDEKTHRAIGNLPSGRGVLGLLIEDPRPLRLRDIGSHPRSYGFPSAHPPMHSFLGVPIVVRGEAWGNLYLAEKPGGEFTEIDEEDVSILAGWASVAIENAYQFEASERQRVQLERALRGLRATRDVAAAIGSDASLEHALDLIAKRGRALVEARSLLIMLREGQDLVVVASAGYAERPVGARLPIAESTSGKVLESGRVLRVEDAQAGMLIAPTEVGVDARTALLVPLIYRGARIGVLSAFDHGERREPFAGEHEELLETFAASAAMSVAMAQSVEADRLRSSLAAAESERTRWARELHDETLQSLGSLRVLLAGALRRGDADALTGAVREAIGQLEQEIAALRSLITELRPAALDHLGLAAALEALLERHQETSGLEIDATVDLNDAGDRDAGLGAELETTIYRTIQEALTNIVKHAQASSARVAVADTGDQVVVEVSDDGIGFDPASESSGYGLMGMRERVTLAGGMLDIVSGEDGTRVLVTMPKSSLARGEGAGAPAATTSQRSPTEQSAAERQLY